MQLSSRPTFSVLIAAFEAADTVGAAIESVLSQVPPPFEVIVCDDGSTDDIAGALAPFADDIAFLRLSHGGEAAAKNAASRAATGEYIVFLDADDTYLPGRIDALGELAMARPDLDILTTDAELEAAGQVIRRCYHADYRFAVDDQDVEILRHNFVFGHAAVRRTRFLAVGGFDESISHTTDWDCWVRMILDGSRVGLVDEPLARYRLHEGSLSGSRAAMSRGRLQTLSNAASRHDLTPAQRAAVDGSLARERVRLCREELRDALVAGVHVRGRALAAVRMPGMPWSTRARALVAFVAPRAAGRRVQHDAATSSRTVGGTRLPRPTGD